MSRKNVNSFILAAALPLAALLLAACASSAPGTPSPQAAVTRPGRLTPYASPSATITATPPDPSTPPPMPSATATPLVHEVKKGEDMMGIALRYGLTLEELKAANPSVDPRFMSIGAQLIIPASKAAATPTPDSGPAAGQTPTPIPLEAGAVTCAGAQDGGVWCFQLARNTQDFPLEGLTAIFRLAGSSVEPALTQRAFLPLDRLPPGGALPLVAYFSAADASGLTGSLHGSSEILVALSSPEDGRYLASHPANAKVIISADGLSASITLDVVLDQPDAEARRIWVAAVAYDAENRVIGVRRWEKSGETPLIKTGQSMPVQMNLYSVAGAISRVDMVTELRP